MGRQPVDGHSETERSGASLLDWYKEQGNSSVRVDKLWTKFGGIGVSLITRVKELEDENRRLNNMCAKEWLKAEVAKDLIVKKWQS